MNPPKKKILILTHPSTQILITNYLLKHPNLEISIEFVLSILDIPLILEKNQFDLILFDLENNSQNLDHLIGLKLNIPIILLLLPDQEEISMQFFKIGIFDTLTKDPNFNYLKKLPLLLKKIKSYYLLNERIDIFNSILEQSPSMIMITNTDKIIEYINPKFTLVTGFTKLEAIGKPASFLKSGKTSPNTYDNLKKTLSQGLEWHGEFINLKKNNQQYYEHASVSPIYNHYGQIIRYLKIAEDITEDKRKEQMLYEMLEELSSVNEILEQKIKSTVLQLREKDQMMIHQSKQAAFGEMLENIAHQWKQPLNQIGLLVQSLIYIEKDGKISLNDAKQVVNDSMATIQFMAQTIDDFRNFFRPNKQKTDFNLKELVTRLISFISHNFKNKNISIQLTSPENIIIHGFPNEYAQVLINLFNNAKDNFLEKKVLNPTIWIEISLIAHEKKSLLIFKDNGGGIPPQHISRIFQPYFTTKKEGTGLGLYMSKMIIEKSMSGSIEVLNNNLGAEFRIKI